MAPESWRTCGCECGCEQRFDARRPSNVCKKCSKHQPKTQYVVAGFGSKGNGAHVTRATHGERG